MLSIDAWLDEKPYKELYDGMVHKKVSPKLAHSLVVGELESILRRWARNRGPVGPELRVYLGEGTTLVPDVSFTHGSRLKKLTEEERETPPFAPDIVVEVRSPSDRVSNIKRKADLYLSHGAKIVLDVDTRKRTVRVIDKRSEIVFASGETVSHPAFPDLELSVDEIFQPLDQKWTDEP